MSDAQQIRRAVERFQRGRRWEHSAFPTSSGGLLHTPYPRQSGGQPRTSGGGGDITIGQAPIGEIVRADAHGHLSPGGEPIVWSNVLHRLGFASATFPNVELRLPHTAVYGIEGDLSWTDGFLFGGRLSLLLNGAGIPGLSPIRAGGPVANAVGQTFTLAQEFVANEGDRLMIVMDHSGDAHHDLHGVIEVATKEPLRVAVQGDMAFQSFSSASAGDGLVTLDRPDDTESGDLLILLISKIGGTDGTLNGTDAGLFTVGAFDQSGVSGSGSTHRAAAIAWRRTGGSEPSTYQVRLGPGVGGAFAVLALVKGAADPTKFDSDATAAGGNLDVGPLASVGSLLFAATVRVDVTGLTLLASSTNNRHYRSDGLISAGSWSATWATQASEAAAVVVMVDPA